MYRRIIAILLIFCMSLHCAAKLGIVAYFYSNQSYIVKVLCINKEKPKLHCEGRCFLTKKLQTAEEHDKQLPSSLKVVEDTVFLVYVDVLKSDLHYSRFYDKQFSLFVLKHYKSPYSQIELPPKIELVNASFS